MIFFPVALLAPLQLSWALTFYRVISSQTICGSITPERNNDYIVKICTRENNFTHCFCRLLVSLPHLDNQYS